MMADVDAGSHTPSMVSKVLTWRKKEPEQGDWIMRCISNFVSLLLLLLANALWKELDHNNELVLTLFTRLNELHSSDNAAYQQGIKMCQALPACQVSCYSV
jgi:phosphomevalonate kinase